MGAVVLYIRGPSLAERFAYKKWDEFNKGLKEPFEKRYQETMTSIKEIEQRQKELHGKVKVVAAGSLG